MPPAADIAWKKLQEIGYGAFDLAPNLLIAIIVFVGFAVSNKKKILIKN